MKRIALALTLSLAVFNGLASTKQDLIIEVLKTAKDFSGIAGIASIIKGYPEIYRQIPHAHPLGRQDYRLTSGFGYRTHPISQIRKLHAGIDLASDYANKVHATANGEVIFAGTQAGYGKLVIIEHSNGFQTYYAHLTYIYSKVGEKVKSGNVVGFVGSTGQSTGNHLHYEIRKDGVPINPMPFIVW